MRSLQTRLEAKVERTDTCWLWLGCRDRDGYGQISDQGRMLKAHRVSYETYVGPIPDGFQVDHLCCVTSCVRPDHLEAVPPALNNIRSSSPSSLNARKQQCRWGHDLDRFYSGQRRCSTCERARRRRRREVAR